MKKIGIVGGVGWPSTVDYYAGLCRRAEARHRASGGRGLAPMPEMTIESLDHGRAVEMLGRLDEEESWAGFDAYHREALLRLEAAGAELAVIASNTAHHRLEAMSRGLSIPILSIIDEAARACARRGLHRVLLLGTAVTMRSPRFREGFARFGVEAAGPADGAMFAAVGEVIGAVNDGRLEGAADRLTQRVRDFRGGVCLGCTELPLVFGEAAAEEGFERGGVKYINANAAHLNAVFARASE